MTILGPLADLYDEVWTPVTILGPITGKGAFNSSNMRFWGSKYRHRLQYTTSN